MNLNKNSIPAALKILYLFCYLVIVFLPRNLNYILIASFILIALLLVDSKIPLKFYLKKVFKIFNLLVILTIFIISASYQYNFGISFMIVLKYVFFVLLCSYIELSSTKFELAQGIFMFLKNINVFSINEVWLFQKIYNWCYLKKDFKEVLELKLEALELKGHNIRNKNLIVRFFKKLDLVGQVIPKVQSLQKKRSDILKKTCKEVRYVQKLNYVAIVYFGAFLLLIGIYISKVI